MNSSEETTSVKTKSPDAEKYRGMAIVAYVIFFIPLLTEAKNSPYVKFHVKQGLILTLASIASSVIYQLPVLGGLASTLGSILVLVLWVIGIMNAINGQQKELPVIGKYAEQWFKF